MDCEMDAGEPGSAWRDNSGYTHVELYSDGSYKAFVPEIETEWMIGRRPIVLKAGQRVKFSENGQLESCVLAAEATLDVFGVPVVAAADDRVEFHASGDVRSFTVGAQPSWIPWRNRAWKYRGEAYGEGTTLELSEDGAVASAAIATREERA